MAKKTTLHLLIRTKLNRPAVASDQWVLRSHLFKQLDAVQMSRLALISAPAGYGKTSLISQWLEQKSRFSAWLSLDQNDNDPARFLRYMILAVSTAIPGFGKGIEGIFSAKKLPPPDHLADLMISELLEFQNPFFLVLDDYQAILSEDIHAILMRLVENLPAVLRLIVISRTDPPWPLRRWRVRGWLQELRAEDMSFTEEETRTLLHPYHLESETLGALHKRTEGWVAALKLLQLSLAEAENPEQSARKFSDQDHMIMDYLMDEVISHQPPEILEFLSVTAMLDRFCAPLCDALIADQRNGQTSRQFLDLLESKNLFLFPLDKEHMWFRYHHLFQTNLMYHLKKNLSPKCIAELHRKAGEWFAGQGLIEEALRHLIAADDVDTAVALVEENLHVVIDKDLSRRVLGFWLSMFSKLHQERYPALLIAQAYRKVFHWDIAGVQYLLDKAAALLSDATGGIQEDRRKNLLGDIDVQRGFSFYWQGNVEEAHRYAHRGLEIVPKTNRYAYCLSLMYMAFSAVCINGDRLKVQRMLSDALREDCAFGSHNAGTILFTQAAIHFSSGNIKAVEDTLNKMLALHDTMHLPDYWFGNVLYYLGMVAYERNNLEMAEYYFRQVKDMRYRIITRNYHDSLLGLALVARARSDANEARNYATLARQFAVEMSDPYSMRLSDSFEIRLAMLSGELQEEYSGNLQMADSYFIGIEIPSLTYTEYLVFTATPENGDVVLGVIDFALQQVERHHCVRQVIHFLAVKALALQVSGHLTEALDVLEKALRMAKPFGFIRTFIDRGSLMAKLLRILSAKRPDDSYVRRLLKAFQDETEFGNKAIGLTEGQHKPSSEQISNELIFGGLSNREIDVLLLLDERLSNKEISQRLYISPETVKKHTISIYRKLDANKRQQAIINARKLGLLPRR